MREIMNLLCEMIRIPSLPGEEQGMAEYVSAYLRPFCDEVRVDSMFNVIAEVAGDRPGPTVLFNAHMDTVPPAEMPDPFAGIIMPGERFGTEGEVVYGRGACDDKGGVAAMMTAAQRLAADRNFPGRLILTFVTQEENGQAPGTVFALKHLNKPVDFAVLGEPTGLDLYLGHRGKVEFFFDATGRSAHASNPANGVNAVELLSDFMQRSKTMPLPTHPILGKCSLCVTYISCPDPGKAAIVPAEAHLRFDRRYLPDETPASVQAQLEACLRELSGEDSSHRYSLTVNYVMPPYYIEPESPVVRLLQASVTAVRSVPARYKTWISGTDGTFMVNDFGIPTIGLGPGDEMNIHSDRDHVSGRQLVEAAEIYERIVRASDT